ncbi:MAG: Hpt domain-containing protein [Candidatus Promineifilaceae bacterium]|jgi:HPt (histidine-containing phosphotransfer) domain-containing protein
MSDVIINQGTFNRLKDLVGEDFIGELTETFFEEGPGLLEDMRSALESGDADTFRRSAHSLKSNSASFGAEQMESMARDMEYLGRDGKLDEAREHMADLESSYERAVAELKGLL